MSKQARIRSIAVFFIIMFSMSLIENFKGVIVPQVKQGFEVSSLHISYMLTWSSIAFVTASYFTGNLAKKFSQKTTEFIAILSILFASFLIILARSFITFVLGMMVLNVGLGMNGVILNSVVPVLAQEAKSTIVNRLHFMYGLGATLGQMVTGFLLGQGLAFQKIYIATAVLFAVLLWLSTTISYPEDPDLIIQSDQAPTDHSIYRDPKFYLMTLAMGLYVFAEIGLGNWLVDYLNVTQNMGEDQAGFYIALFFFFLAMGRLFGGNLVDKLGKFQAIIFAILLGASLVLMGLILAGPFYFLISLAGLFYSIVFPTSIVLISQIFDRDISQTTGKILTFNSLALMVYNQLVGWVTDGLGFHISIYLLPTSAILAAVLYFILYKLSQRQTPSSNS